MRESVESALGQTVSELEVVVVDDGSPEPIAGALEGIEDERLRLVRLDRNRGVSAARNAGLRLARTELVSQLDSDDVWEPEYLEAILPSFDDPSVGLAYSNALIDGHPGGLDDYIGDASPHPIDTFPKIAEQNPVPALTATMRVDAVRRAGGWPRWLRVGEDYWLYMSLARAGWRFRYVNRHLARYRWPQADRGVTFDDALTQRELLKLYTAFTLRHPLTPGPRRQVRTRVRALLRR